MRGAFMKSSRKLVPPDPSGNRMNDDHLERILETPSEEEDLVDRLPRNGEDARIRPAGGLAEGFWSIDARQLLATEDGVRVYLRDMAKTRLVSRTEELDLAYR